MFGVFDGTAGNIFQAVGPLIFARQTLQPAVAIGLTPHTVIGVTGQQPFYVCLAKCQQLVCVGLDNITLPGLSDTGGLWIVVAFDIDEAHATDGIGRESWVVAQCRYMDAGLAGRIEQGGTIIQFDRPAIDRQFDHV